MRRSSSCSVVAADSDVLEDSSSGRQVAGGRNRLRLVVRAIVENPCANMIAIDKKKQKTTVLMIDIEQLEEGYRWLLVFVLLCVSNLNTLALSCRVRLRCDVMCDESFRFGILSIDLNDR
mmetsp:Transcript_45509/g.110227  ORF Transcript_45509/g.110227 Transcript_45509/m.110227 type:complete len:120 (+) Transcript_45509:1730-2089(+)